MPPLPPSSGARALQRAAAGASVLLGSSPLAHAVRGLAAAAAAAATAPSKSADRDRGGHGSGGEERRRKQPRQGKGEQQGEKGSVARGGRGRAAAAARTGRGTEPSSQQPPPSSPSTTPPSGWWGRRGDEKVLKVTTREEITKTPDGEIVRWPRDDRKLLRRTKGRKRLLEKLAKQDAETARLLDLPASTIALPANVPRVRGIDKPLLPRGVTEAGLLPSRYWKKETGPGAVPALRPDNQALADARPQKVNDLLALVKGARNPETRLLAVQQMQFIRTKLTVNEASSVLDEAMTHFGWRAGLRYVERMGERPEHKLSIRHFNKVVRACCRDPELRSLRSVLRVIEEMEGQGVPPNHQTIALGLTAAAERGDAYVAERLLAYARARGIELDKRAQAKAAEALAGGSGKEEKEAARAVGEAEGDGRREKGRRGSRTSKGKEKKESAEEPEALQN